MQANFNKIINYRLNENLTGDLSDGMTEEDIAKKFNVPLKQVQDQITKGIKVEFEHTNNKEIARKIAMDHLAEGILDYYDHLEVMEKEAKANTKNNVKEEMVSSTVVGSSGYSTSGIAPQDNIPYAERDPRVAKPLFTKKKKKRISVQRRPKTGM